MPLKPDRLERSLHLAKENLSRFESKLSEKGVANDVWRKNPRWRNLNSTAKQIQGRIDTANDLITRGQRPEPTAETPAEE